jgi:hypothetical protein
MLQKYFFARAVKTILFLLLFIPWLISCNKFDGDQTIPAYIHIENIKLEENPFIFEGTLSNKITDAWVYVDDILIGAFELPATFPVLQNGKHKISIYPGIKMNGMAGTRVQYEFYKSIIITDSNLVVGNTINLDTLHTQYKDLASDNKEIVFWEENFDDATIKFQKRINSDTTVIQTNLPNVFEGSHSGIVTIDSQHNFFEMETKGDNFVLPKGASPVFLEMNYKTNNSLYIGLLVYQPNQSYPSNQVSTIKLKPTTEWKKIYINFTPDISDYYSAGSFKVFFGAYKDEGIQTAEIYLDNIKLVHFKTSK